MGVPDGRGLRVDAARNHERIVVAAALAFEEDGAAVSLEEIASRAGVGVATVYRRFGSRERLVKAVVEHVFASEIEPAVVTDGPDPWHDLVASLTASVQAIAAHRVLVGLARESASVDMEMVKGFTDAITRVLARAQDAGLARSELTGRDMGAIVVMALAVTRVKGSDSADTYRYLALLTDGMRPAAQPLPQGSRSPDQPSTAATPGCRAR